MVFCLTCGSGYNNKHDLLNHLKENSTCRMNENVKFLENIETKRGGHLLHSLIPKLVNVFDKLYFNNFPLKYNTAGLV